MITNVDLYLRLSDGRDLATLAAREAALRREADRRGWTVYRVVTENDLSTGRSRGASAFKRRVITLPNGKKARRVVRPGFRSILDDLAEGRAQALLAEDLDRVVRDPRDGEDLLDVAEERKATVDSLSGSLKLTNGGTDSEVHAFRANVNSANKASRDTARRVKEGRERTAYSGQWGGGRRPYGFQPEPHPEGSHQNTVLVIDPHECEVIRWMADQVLKGITLASIAQALREREEPTVTGTRWTAETVKDILSKPLIAGIVVYDGKQTEVRLPGEPILSEDVWRAVVDKMNSPMVEWTDRAGVRRSAPRAQGKGRAPKWLGTGIYLCVCGSTMEIQLGRGRTPAYRCARDESSQGDVHVRRNAELLDRYVARRIVERLADADAFALLVKKAKPEIDVEGIRVEVRGLTERKNALGEQFADGVIDEDQLKRGTRRIRQKLDALNEQLAEATRETSLTRLVAPFNPLVQLADTAQVWLGLSLGERRSLVNGMATVTILPTKRSRGFDENDIRIEWKTPA